MQTCESKPILGRDYESGGGAFSEGGQVFLHVDRLSSEQTDGLYNKVRTEAAKVGWPAAQPEVVPAYRGLCVFALRIKSV